VLQGIDSSYARPTAALVAAFKSQGVAMWSGYLATRGGVQLASPWTQADFNLAKQLPAQPIAYCSGWDDPGACKALAAAWGVRLCLDVESSIRADGSWVQGWLDASGAGLYGNAPVHPNRRAPFHILAAYPGGGNPGATWAAQYPRPAGPVGWQWQGGHTENGISCDRANFDDWFGGAVLEDDDEMMIVNTISDGIWLLTGFNYVHIPVPADVAILQAGGAKYPAGQISDGLHHELQATFAGGGSGGGGGAGKITGQITIS
jgi:hypothetical protein